MCEASAQTVSTADECGIRNLSVISAHKTMPQVLKQLLRNENNIDGLICPGHVAAITGAKAFSFIPDDLLLPAAVAGFEALDIMMAISTLVHMIRNGERKCVNTYPRAVTACGNTEALSLVGKIFEPCDALWRGLGKIDGSGLAIRERYRNFNAAYQ